MNESKISTRYAKALYLLAAEQNSLEDTSKNMQILQTLYNESDDFKRVIADPVLKTSDKTTIISSLLTGTINTQILNFVLLIIKNKRETFLPAVIRNYISLYKKQKGIVEAELQMTAQPDKKVIDDITAMIKRELNASADLTVLVNESLIGGFILRVEDIRYDASVASQLKNIKRELTKKTYN